MSIANVNDGTGKGLIAFLEQASREGSMNDTTARSYRASVTKVLEAADPFDDGSGTDIRTLDVEAVLETFEEARGDDYAEGSLASYKTRFRRAVEMYLQFLDDPESVRRPARRRPRVKGSYGVSALRSDAIREPAHASPPIGNEMMEYRFPLTDGGTAYLRLPRLLPAADVDRLTRFLKSIAIDPSGQTRLPLVQPE
jgi:hypothetical protein